MVLLFIDRNLFVYFDSFGIEYIPQEVLNKIRDKSITDNIFRIQDNESIMCGFYCIAFIKYMLAGKTLLDYTNLFSPNYYKKNDKIIYKYFKDMVEEASLEFRLRKNDETRNYLLDEIKHNDLIREKYKKTCKYLQKRHAENLLLFVSKVTGCVSISAFASLVAISVGITSSAVGIKICAIIGGIKKYKSLIKKKKKRYYKIVLLGKDKANTIEILISKALIDSYISHDEFVSVSNVLREYYEMKTEIKNLETSVECTI